MVKGNPPEALGSLTAVKRSVAGYCPFYEIHKGAKEGDGFCIKHEPPNQNEFYLRKCQPWPNHPSQIKNIPQCGYSFTWQE